MKHISNFIIMFLFFICSDVMARPYVHIIATGGTIAGTGISSADAGYKAGELGIEELIRAVPEIHDIADIRGEQMVNIGSQDMCNEIWLMLANRINHVLMNPGVDGVVVTHGTDTMEETAYFLNLTVKSNKPVVLVGAMRPSTSLSADGPMNLLNAVSVAADSNAVGRGVMVMMNGHILGARSVFKMNTLDVAGFGSSCVGQLGYVQGTEVHFLARTTHCNTAQCVFDVKGLKSLPKVGIVYSHSDVNPDVMEPFLTKGYEGIVHAGVGNGNIHKNLLPLLAEASNKGIIVVRSSRVPTGPTSINGEVDDNKYGFIASMELNPQKARVLLMLALTKTHDRKEIQQYFLEF